MRRISKAAFAIAAALMVGGAGSPPGLDEPVGIFAGHVDVVHRDQAGLADREFLPDGFTDRPFQQFTHPLKSKRRHNKMNYWMIELLDRWENEARRLINPFIQ